MALDFSIVIRCPVCNRGKVFGTKDTKGSISVQCSKCGKTYLADFNRTKSEAFKPIKNT